MKRTVILVFGEMGAGKSYWAMKISRMFKPGAIFVEGDKYVPFEMSLRIAKMLPPTQDQIEELVGYLANAPVARFARNEGIHTVVLSQALYRNEHRERLFKAWTEEGYNVVPVWVRVPFWQNLRQLWKRDRGGLKWVLYWLMNKPFFQTPTHRYSTVEDVAAIASYK